MKPEGLQVVRREVEFVFDQMFVDGDLGIAVLGAALAFISFLSVLEEGFCSVAGMYKHLRLS